MLGETGGGSGRGAGAGDWRSAAFSAWRDTIAEFCQSCAPIPAGLARTMSPDLFLGCYLIPYLRSVGLKTRHISPRRSLCPDLIAWDPLLAGGGSQGLGYLLVEVDIGRPRACSVRHLLTPHHPVPRAQYTKAMRVQPFPPGSVLVTLIVLLRPSIPGWSALRDLIGRRHVDFAVAVLPDQSSPRDSAGRPTQHWLCSHAASY